MYDLPLGVGLGYEIHGAQLQTFHLGFLVRGQHDDGNLIQLRVLLEAFQHRKPGHAGHLQIQHDQRQLVLVFPYGNHGLRAVGGVQHLVAVLQGLAQNLLVDELVLGDEDVPAHLYDFGIAL